MSSRGNYLFPVRALSRRFRGRMVAALRAAADAGELHRVTRPGEVDTVLDTLMATDWVVYTRDCLEHTPTVVDYLARYTRRIAITNARILAVDDEHVTLRCRDYRDRGRHRALELQGTEFVRRFLLHVLPKGLMRVRHYGFLANRCRREKLARIRAALAAPAPEPRDPELQGGAVIPHVCPRCRRPAMRVTAAIAPQYGPRPPEARRRPH
ncbi:MAG: transposase [Halofilum sp. (in: g-proteobacteria)]|nr:transposase [Halofilum sp. (in: g-proteobacteria)]